MPRSMKWARRECARWCRDEMKYRPLRTWIRTMAAMGQAFTGKAALIARKP